MQVILDTETTVDISSMTELKDNIKEKLVNQIIEDFNLSSSDKENTEKSDNVMFNGKKEDDCKEIDDQVHIVKVKSESIHPQIGTNLENNDNLIEKHEGNDVSAEQNTNDIESQNESNSNSNSASKKTDILKHSVTELKYILKQEVINSIVPNQTEETAVDIPVLDNIEQGGDKKLIEDTKDVQILDDESQSEPSSNESEDVVEVKSDDVEIIKEQESVVELNQSCNVPTRENMADNVEPSNETDEVSIVEEESNTLKDKPPIIEETKIQEKDTEKASDVVCIETVVIDGKNNDISIKEVESMETDVTEQIVNDTSRIININETYDATENSTLKVATTNAIQENKDEVVVVEDAEIMVVAPMNEASTKISEDKVEQSIIKKTGSKCRLSNTLDILSDDDEDPPTEEASKTDLLEEPHKEVTAKVEKQSTNIEEDDDIMVIEEESPKDVVTNTDNIKETVNEPAIPTNDTVSKIDEETSENKSSFMESIELVSNDTVITPLVNVPPEEIPTTEKATESVVQECDSEKPLLPVNLLSLPKKKISEMSREELEEFCILKIVEGVMDRSQLNDTSSKLKAMAQNYDEQRKKVIILAKQNRDLQVILKSIQEEQTKLNEKYNVITPLRITRSVGMQVLISDKTTTKRKNTNSQVNRQQKSPASGASSARPQKPAANQNIPVPRLVPAINNGIRSPTTNVSNVTNNVGKSPTAPLNGVKTPVPKAAEKRPFSKVQSVTVDLTDDEPPAKVRGSPAPPVRVVPTHNLMNSSLSQMLNSPRKVFIPIGTQPNTNLRNNTFLLKPVTPNAPKPRVPGAQAVNNIRPQNQGRVRPSSINRHPAPLPEPTRQYQPPNWKGLPPAPDLKLSKVENGIVISWKIDGYQEDLHEQIASYQLYAYQETSSPPSTALWKKIGDVKALPLPMACTLTQFTAGFKYFFAVRAVDVRSRLGPFSLPGSILLLQKL